ncbi:hypothetical protein S83_033370 [Arachis hypogaea]|nr:uncharacterized protein DS421_10g311560 [Arachis hypogaea]
MKSKFVLMVSHELSFLGGPLLLMELVFLLRKVGVDVVWITNQKPPEPDQALPFSRRKFLLFFSLDLGLGFMDLGTDLN